MDDRTFASATQLSKEIRDRCIDCVELPDFYLARVERYNPSLNAIVVKPTKPENAPARDRESAEAAKRPGDYSTDRHLTIRL